MIKLNLLSLVVVFPVTILRQSPIFIVAFHLSPPSVGGMKRHYEKKIKHFKEEFNGYGKRLCLMLSRAKICRYGKNDKEGLPNPPLASLLRPGLLNEWIRLSQLEQQASQVNRNVTRMLMIKWLD